MLKSIHKQKRRASLAVHRATKKATAAGLLIALTAGVSFAQSLPAAQANRTAQSESQADVATPLTLQRAIALALDGNPDLTVAKREIEATCQVPDDCIDPRRRALFIGRETMRELIEELRRQKS